MVSGGWGSVGEGDRVRRKHPNVPSLMPAYLIYRQLDELLVINFEWSLYKA